MQILKIIMPSRVFRIFWSLYLTTFSSSFKDKWILTSKSWVFFVSQSPFKFFVFASTEFIYPRWLIRLMYRKNCQSYWINTTSSIDGLNKNLTRLWEEVLSKSKCRYVLILSDGDAQVSTVSSPILLNILDHSLCKRIYAQNLCLDNNTQILKMKLLPIPIGFDLHTYRRRLNPKLLVEYLKQTSTSKRQKSVNAIIDFESSSVSPVRGETIETAQSSSFFYKLPKRLDQFELWDCYREVHIVVSPRGGGLDCHRTWEALWFGCVVVVITDGIESLFENVPNVVYVRNVSELEEVELLKRRCADAKIAPNFRVSLYDFVIPDDLPFIDGLG